MRNLNGWMTRSLMLMGMLSLSLVTLACDSDVDSAATADGGSAAEEVGEAAEDGGAGAEDG